MSGSTTNFDHINRDLLRQEHRSKWGKYDADVLPLWVADLDFPVAPPVARAIQDAVSSGYHMYPLASMYDQVNQAFADRCKKMLGQVVDPSLVLQVSELVQAMHTATFAFTEPGDGVLILTPIYPPFLGVPEQLDRRLVEHRMEVRNGTYTFDIEALRSLVEKERPKVFLLCNPHNPLGRAFSEVELRKLGDLAIEFDMVVIADEVHSELVFAPNKHVAFTMLGPEIAARTITISSASKSFSLASIRCAFMAFGSQVLKDSFHAKVSLGMLGKVPAIGLIGTLTAWEQGDEWFASCFAYLSANRTYVADRIAAIENISYINVEATYLAWLDLRAVGVPGVAAEHLLEFGRVALNEGPSFGTELEGYARLNFATSREILTEALDRIEAWAAR